MNTILKKLGMISNWAFFNECSNKKAQLLFIPSFSEIVFIFYLVLFRKYKMHTIMAHLGFENEKLQMGYICACFKTF